VRDRGPSVQHSGLGQQHPTGTDRGEFDAALVEVRERAGQVALLGLGPRARVRPVVPATAGYDHEVRVGLAEEAVHFDSETVAGGDGLLGVERAQTHVEVTTPSRGVREHFVGCDRVQLVEAVVDDDRDFGCHVGGSQRTSKSVFSRTVGVRTLDTGRLHAERGTFRVERVSRLIGGETAIRLGFLCTAMATEATFEVDSDQFPLGTVFENQPDVTVQLERLVPAEDAIIPYVWVRGADGDGIDATFESHPGVRRARLIDSVDDDSLLKVEWDPESEGFLRTLAETDLLLLSATGTESNWTFEIRGDDHADVAAFEETCRDRGIDLRLTAVHALTPLDGDGDYGLTEAQREALELAYERGYFDSPRQVTLAEIAAEIDISQQALAARIRRGTRSLLGETVVK